MEITLRTANTSSPRLATRPGELFQAESSGKTIYLRLDGFKYVSTDTWTIYDYSDPDNAGKDYDIVTIIGSIWID